MGGTSKTIRRKATDGQFNGLRAVGTGCTSEYISIIRVPSNRYMNIIFIFRILDNIHIDIYYILINIFNNLFY